MPSIGSGPPAPWSAISATSSTWWPARPMAACSPSTASPAARSPTSRPSIPCPDIAAWARCGSAIRLTGRCSTTCTARPSSPRPTCSSTAAWSAGDTLDASLLRLNELGFLADDDPRFAGTVAAIERELRRGDFILRYVEQDDFGTPENAFLVCTFWYINALAAIGRRDEARALFENVLACCNRHGLLAEHVDPRTREQWGNFVQTYSMVGLIGSAIRLSVRWDQAF